MTTKKEYIINLKKEGLLMRIDDLKFCATIHSENKFNLIKSNIKKDLDELEEYIRKG